LADAHAADEHANKTLHDNLDLATDFFSSLFRVFCEEVFTAEA